MINFGSNNFVCVRIVDSQFERASLAPFGHYTTNSALFQTAAQLVNELLLDFIGFIILSDFQCGFEVFVIQQHQSYFVVVVILDVVDLLFTSLLWLVCCLPIITVCNAYKSKNPTIHAAILAVYRRIFLGASDRS